MKTLIIVLAIGSLALGAQGYVSSGSLSVLRRTNRGSVLCTLVADSPADDSNRRQTSRRRALFSLGGGFFPMVLAGGIRTPPAVAATPTEVEAVQRDIEALIDQDVDFGPTLVRLAWHSSGTYDRMTRTGGSGKGTIRFTEELTHGANAGLEAAVKRLEPVHAKHPSMSYADLYTLAGVVAIYALGGPIVGWKGGRVDSMDPKDVTPDGRLPEADKGGAKETAAHLREVFGRMGFSDRELVALSGAHTIGYCRPETSGYTGKWTPSPRRFNNMYYRILLNMRWDEKVVNGGKPQYGLVSGTLMMLPSDIALIKDDALVVYVREYAADESKWFADFAAAFQKLLELGL